MRQGVRAPVAAGSFYAAAPEQLAAHVDALLTEARQALQPLPAGKTVRGVIAPHAGYVYSGPIAASAYTVLSSAAVTTQRIVILGPSHFVPLRGMALPSHRAWGTPLGEVVIDAAGREALLAAGASVDDEVHRSEHSIEVQLPFIQRCFGDLPVLPVAVGDGDPGVVAERLGRLLTETSLLVVSTDLSHYHDAVTARRLDARTAAAVEALDLAGLGRGDACGYDPLRAGMAWARRCGCRIGRLDLRDSAHTAGDPSRVVGYGAFAITTPAR